MRAGGAFRSVIRRRFVFARRPGRIALAAIIVIAGLTATPPAEATATVAVAVAAPDGDVGVVFNELAAASSLSPADSFFEVRNTSDATVDLSGWTVYRCDGRGLRVGLGIPDVQFDDVALAPGEIYTAAHMSARRAADAADSRFSSVFAPEGFGLVLVAPNGVTVDSVAVYPNEPWPTQSECGRAPNLPVVLAAALDESWQRTDEGEWVRATSTPGSPNAQRTQARSGTGIRIDEIAAAGPGGSGDDVVELVNAGSASREIAGWRLYRCTARGEARTDTLQVEFPDGAHLRAGERLVIGGPAFDGATFGRGEPDVRTTTSLADAVSGVLVVDEEGRRVDGVTLSSHADTACQTGDSKLDAGLDYRSGESWQRDPAGAFVVAPRTPGASMLAFASIDGAASSSSALRSDVAISEFAVDPEIDTADAGLQASVVRHHFVEIAGYAAQPRQIGGWQIVGCGLDGFRSRTALATIPPGTVLEPGKTWVAALRGTDAAAGADAVFDEPLDFRGAGFSLLDADGVVVDRVGAYHVNEMDRSVDTSSACSAGLTLTVFAVDRLRGETYQRAQQTQDNAADFVPAPATPGILAPRTVIPPAVLVAEAALRLRTAADRVSTPRSAHRLESPASSVVGGAAQIVAAVAGSSDGALQTASMPGEVVLDTGSTDELVSSDEGYRHPYLRLTVQDASLPGIVGWRGTVIGGGAVRLSVWNSATGQWRQLATTDLADASSTDVSLSGRVRADEVREGGVELLVQTLARGSERLIADEAMADPADYDFAISHLTDTQYLSEAYPETYADVIGWVIANADRRKIAFATHTGDLIQNWVDPDQPEQRARREYDVASSMQAALDAAGVPNSVLPGNHDSKRGVSPELFNEYFGPERYADQSWYGGSIAPGDNTANFSTFTAGGARMLMLSLPYAYGEREIAWAEQVVSEHPDHNVVVSTHEHVTPKTREAVAGRSNSSRWLSHADQLWNRVIAPHRNVVLVLSGHFHGLGQIVTENAGGIAGHTVVEALADYQEFRTHTGERATGFSRLVQFDLGGERIAVDAHSSTMDAATSAPFDYEQFVRDDGHEVTPSNDRPWRVLADGLQNRYGVDDDHFVVDIQLQHIKSVHSSKVIVDPGE